MLRLIFKDECRIGKVDLVKKEDAGKEGAVIVKVKNGRLGCFRHMGGVFVRKDDRECT